MGLYAQCIEDIDTALGLDKNKSSALEQKLVPRLVKSYLQANDPKAAVDALNRVSESGDKAVMEFICRRLANSSLPNEHKYRRDRLQQLPRYLPSLDPVREHYVVGMMRLVRRLMPVCLISPIGPFQSFLEALGTLETCTPPC